MTEHPMEMTFRTALWRQFGAAIDMLENALLACPDLLWRERLWSDLEAPAYPTFWSLTHHTLFWLDLYLTGSLEAFAPPTPFSQDEFGPARVLPEQAYPKEELLAYLVQLRQKCQTTLLSLSDEQAHRQVAFPWRWWKPMSFFELQLYTLRHVQEHAAQLSLFLGQHGIPGEVLDWVGQAKDEAGRLSPAGRKFGPTATDGGETAENGAAGLASALCRLAHPALHLVSSAETGPCHVSMTGLSSVSVQVCAAHGGTGYACLHREACAVMRTHADRMTLDTVSEDRGKALPEWKGTRNTAHDRIAMVPGACLANEPTWPLPSFLLTGCRSCGDAHGWDSGPGNVCC